MAEPIDRGLHVASVTLRVADVRRVSAFYGDVLGLQVVTEDDLVIGLGDDGVVLLTLDQRSVAPGAQANPRSTGLFHTAFLYPTRPALANALARVAAAGWPLDGAADHGVSEALYLSDPEGNGVELYHDRPRAQWPPPQQPGDRVGMFTAALDVRRLLADADATAAEQLGRPADAGVGVGHAHLKVSDVDASVAFYTRVLGLDLMCTYGQDAAFLAAGGYHHHVGVNCWYSRGGTPPPQGAPGLARVTFGVEDEERAQAVFERLHALGAAPQRDADATILVTDPDSIQLAVTVWPRNPTAQT
jgi:catechol 2,3-dioxygenase